MVKPIQASIVEQAKEQGYQLLKADSDRLLFSLDGKDDISCRNALERLERNDAPPDFIALSTDFRFQGALATGWKSGSLMMLRLTEKASDYIAMTDDELRALGEKLRKLPTPEERSAIEARIDETLGRAQRRAGGINLSASHSPRLT